MNQFINHVQQYGITKEIITNRLNSNFEFKNKIVGVLILGMEKFDNDNDMIPFIKKTIRKFKKESMESYEYFMQGIDDGEIDTDSYKKYYEPVTAYFKELTKLSMHNYDKLDDLLHLFLDKDDTESEGDYLLHVKLLKKLHEKIIYTIEILILIHAMIYCCKDTAQFK